MEKKRMLLCACFVLMLLITVCSATASAEVQDTASLEETPGVAQSMSGASGPLANNRVNELAYTTPDGETGYLYIPDSVLNQPEKKVPMVLMMMCTGGDARENAKACGWVDKAQEEGIIVLAPVYNNYATYSELDGIVSAVAYVAGNYPVDTSRIYTTGFSNGGAVSVALTSEYPQLFAAISAYGWMVDMRNHDEDYDMPFQVIQGTEEYTYSIQSGAMAIMEDEQRAIRSLFLFNEMIDSSVLANYDSTPYWGYSPDDSHTISPDGRVWTVSNYYKDNYRSPFAQLVLIDGAGHQPNTSEAEVSWNFFKHFSRSENGQIIEQAE